MFKVGDAFFEEGKKGEGWGEGWGVRREGGEGRKVGFRGCSDACLINLCISVRDRVRDPVRVCAILCVSLCDPVRIFV